MTSPVTIAAHAAIAPVTASGRVAPGSSSGGPWLSRVVRAGAGRSGQQCPILTTVQAGTAEARRGKRRPAADHDPPSCGTRELAGQPRLPGRPDGSGRPQRLQGGGRVLGASRARAAEWRLCMISRTITAVPLGVRPTRTPTFSSASFFAWAVPEEPETIAPAWPMVLPSGAVNPAT